MWKYISLALKATAILALPLLIQNVGSKYLAHRMKSTKEEEVLENAYAMMRDGNGKPRIPGAELLNWDELDSAKSVSKPKTTRAERAVAPSNRPTVLMRYTSPDVAHGQGGSGGTSLMELPPGTTVLFLDGRLQVYHPPAKNEAE
jgi:hypothetical protein